MGGKVGKVGQIGKVGTDRSVLKWEGKLGKTRHSEMICEKWIAMQLLRPKESEIIGPCKGSVRNFVDIKRF